MRKTFNQHDIEPTALRWSDAETDLLDFSIITWDVDPQTLAAQLPHGYEPETFMVDGREVSFVSAVPFRDKGFHFKFAPFIKVSMAQINLRAYVIYRGERVAWFFGTLLTGMWNWIPQHVWKLPWYGADIGIQADWEKGVYSVNAQSELSDVSIELSDLDQPVGDLNGFDSADHAALVLTHPLKGFFYRRDEHLGSYSVWHDRLDLQRATANSARVSLFEKLKLVQPGQEPFSVLVMAKTHFHIHLPPKRVPAILQLSRIDDSEE